jgi:ElaB/YqjD/DUF883 family membrane-anchored ribosome-binding protein
MAETQKWKESDVQPPSGSRSATGAAGRGADYSGDYNAEITHIRAELAKLSDAVGGSVKGVMAPMTRQLETAVARNPTTSVLIAAGVGLLLGLISLRR